jgi:hypothetical protein
MKDKRMSEIKKAYYKDNPMSEEHKNKIAESKKEHSNKQKEVLKLIEKIIEIYK